MLVSVIAAVWYKLINYKNEQHSQKAGRKLETVSTLSNLWLTHNETKPIYKDCSASYYFPNIITYTGKHVILYISQRRVLSFCSLLSRIFLSSCYMLMVGCSSEYLAH